MGNSNGIENDKQKLVGTFVETSFSGDQINETAQSEKDNDIQKTPCAFLDDRASIL